MNTAAPAPPRQISTPAGDVLFRELGFGRPALLLHGGGGPDSTLGFCALLSEHFRVHAPIHPGFAQSPRPEGIATIADIASLYAAMLEKLELSDVVVIGTSIGGWIASELALIAPERLDALILVDAVGVTVPGEAVFDVFSGSHEERSKRVYHNPDRFMAAFASPTEEQKARAAANFAALEFYGRRLNMQDPTLALRLRAVFTRTLVAWGDSDGIVTPAYGRALAETLPNAEFKLIRECGHFPFIEQPESLRDMVLEFVG